jgi:hypothetical protein
MLQHCQHGQPKQRWALKGFHGPRLQAFFATYPDARLIWIHRDPVQVTASRIAMAATLTKAFSGQVNIEEQAAIHLAATRAGIRDTLGNPLVDDARILHVRYPDFVADPVGTIDRFYTFAGISLSATGEAAMREYLSNNRGDRYGKFEYSTAMIGVDIDELHREFAPYRQRFSLEIEQRKA